jgi:hypothetical protein
VREPTFTSAVTVIPGMSRAPAGRWRSRVTPWTCQPPAADSYPIAANRAKSNALFSPGVPAATPPSHDLAIR